MCSEEGSAAAEMILPRCALRAAPSGARCAPLPLLRADAAPAWQAAASVSVLLACAAATPAAARSTS